MAFFLCCVVLLFPMALQRGWIKWWILGVVIFLVIMGTLLPRTLIQKDKSENNKMSSDQTNFNIQENTSELVQLKSNIETPVGESTSFAAKCSSEEPFPLANLEVSRLVETPKDKNCKYETQKEPGSIVGEQDLVEDHTMQDQSPSGLMTLEELIDLGFKAKYADDFEQAAFYFSQALSLDPMPDIAFYLILDCYWLWKNLRERDYALTRLDGYIEKYLPQFNFELRHQFETWLTKENIHKN